MMSLPLLRGTSLLPRTEAVTMIWKSRCNSFLKCASPVEVQSSLTDVDSSVLMYLAPPTCLKTASTSSPHAFQFNRSS